MTADSPWHNRQRRAFTLLMIRMKAKQLSYTKALKQPKTTVIANPFSGRGRDLSSSRGGIGPCSGRTPRWSQGCPSLMQLGSMIRYRISARLQNFHTGARLQLVMEAETQGLRVSWDRQAVLPLLSIVLPSTRTRQTHKQGKALPILSLKLYQKSS